MTINKSAADYVFEHLATQDNTLETDAEHANNTDSNSDGDFSDAELAATVNLERLNALLQECDSFLALADQDMVDFETIDEINKKTDTSNKPISVNNNDN